MSYWARTVDPSFGGLGGSSEPSFEPIRADLVAAPPESPSRGTCASLAARGCRCVGLLLLVVILWQIVAHFWWQRGHRSELDGPPSAVVTDTGQQAAIAVDVYYEALCPDSRKFIVDQLWPAYQRIPNVLRITLVPYGKAKTLPPARAGQVPTFSCHHGPAECRANKVHACGVRLAAGQEQALTFVVCLLRYLHVFESRAPECAEMSSFLWKDVTACAESDDISRVMERHGNRTRALRPQLQVVPTVTVDGSQNQQQKVVSNFLEFACNKYKERTGSRPDGCP